LLWLCSRVWIWVLWCLQHWNFCSELLWRLEVFFDFRGNAFSFFPFSIMLAVGLVKIPFIGFNGKVLAEHVWGPGFNPQHLPPTPKQR
jgi:hypothetical protein